MKDSILKGTGNSRYLKSAIPDGTTWAEALAMLRAGTFPMDLNGINSAGFQQVGTPLNKANLLKDVNALTLGLTGDAVPDDMFNVLAHAGDLHVWKKTVTTSQEIPAGYTLGNALENISPIDLTDKNYNTAWFTVVSSIKIYDNGNAHFTDADSDYTRYMKWDSSDYAFEGYAVVSGNGPRRIRHDAIPGNFIKFWAKSSSWLSSLIDMDSFYFVPGDATVTTGGTPVFSKLQRVVGYAKTPAVTTITYPVSTNRNAYQEGSDAIPANTTIEYLGCLGDKTRTQVVSYVGTGTAGASTPCSLTFDFPPKVVMFLSKVATDGYLYDFGYNNYEGDSRFVIMPFVSNAFKKSVGFGSKHGYMGKKSADGKTLTWYYRTNSPDYQNNSTGCTYYYLAIG